MTDTASGHRNSHCNRNSESSCNCFSNSHCISSESETATITAHSTETVADASAHRNSHCNLNSKSSCNCFRNNTVSASIQQQQQSQLILRKHSKMLQVTGTVTVSVPNQQQQLSQLPQRKQSQSAVSDPEHCSSSP